ncbi:MULTISPECIES: outer membrane protein assembly factor BamA [Limnobacter]|uniref:Outer membrane protein assembly factor BamA n=1 Tax=Limnobacter litoralis TaxID=481366 RepID=A0ABQ5YSG7_9BURK|nr:MULTISPECIES: outer membrane protein assembly factor BamA [Limnobacter]GLR26325.1 outer membrane protein assembly factor BamA [Limnobacter litoralis]
MTMRSRLFPARLVYPVVACCALQLGVAHAAINEFKVKDIRVEGLRRTEAGTVFSYLPVRVGDTFNDEVAVKAIRSLYATGFFDDVKISAKDDVLIVTVVERPAIASVDFNGTKEFDKDTLKNALKGIGISESKIFDRSLLDKAEQELKKQYLARGKYGAQVQTEVKPLPRNRVAITFNVEEGETASIKQLKIIGAKTFKTQDLLDEFQLGTHTWTSWYTKNDQYSRQKLSGDLERLRSFYLNRGYADFSIENTQVQISPNKQDVYITISIKEGDKFKFGKVQLSGDMLDRQKELESLLTIKPGETFNGEQLSDSTKAIQDDLGNYGYAFANANVIPDIDRDTHEVNINIVVDPGKRVYVRRMNIGGNTRTKDEVIRREFRQFESAWYDARKIQLSKERVDKLDYFKDVKVDTQPVPGTSDQVDVNFEVEEKPTGNLLLGAGISSTDALILSAAIQQQNLFGTGKTVGLELNTSKVNRTISFNETDPYFTIDGVSRSFNIYDRQTDASQLNLGNYKIGTTGAGVSFGFPITEYERLSFGTSYEGTNLSVDATSPARYQNYVQQFGNSTYAILLNAGYQLDTRDSAIAPTRGHLRRLSADLATPLGQQEFLKTTYQEQVYFPLSKKYTLALNGEITSGFGFGGKPYPIFRNVYAGGIGSVRGYRASSLGPVDADGVPTGGAKRLIGNAEFYFPLPGLKKDRTFRAFTFLDAGNVYQSNEKISLGQLRYSTGFGISWTSPVGPLKFSLGFPLNTKPTDDIQRIQFTIGTGF